MYVRIVTFRLANLPADAYQAHAAEVAHAFTRWPRLRSKIWLADPDNDTYGGIYLFADRDAADVSRHTDMFRAMTANRHFADLHIAEFEVLADPTAITGGPVALPTHASVVPQR
jgi:hypothetical protein